MSLFVQKSVVMYRKFRNVPIIEDFSPICPYFLFFGIAPNLLSLHEPQWNNPHK